MTNESFDSNYFFALTFSMGINNCYYVNTKIQDVNFRFQKNLALILPILFFLFFWMMSLGDAGFMSIQHVAFTAFFGIFLAEIFGLIIS